MSDPREEFRRFAPVLISAVLSALLFYTGVFAFLFAVPVQVNYTRRGERVGVLSAVVTAVVVVIVHLSQALRFEEVGGEVVRILLVDSLMPIGLLTGLSLFNLLRRLSWTFRLVASAIPTMLAALPSILLLVAAANGDGPLGEQLEAMLASIGMGTNAEYWLTTVKRIVLNTVGLGLTASIAANWWLGRSIVLRAVSGSSSLRAARVPEVFVWPVIGGLAGVLFAWLFDVPAIEPVAWNAMLVASFLFGIQGIGVIQHLLRRRGMSERSERWALTISMALLFIPGLNVLAAIGIPLVGMSEIWIDYKRGEKYEGHSEQ